MDQDGRLGNVKQPENELVSLFNLSWLNFTIQLFSPSPQNAIIKPTRFCFLFFSLCCGDGGIMDYAGIRALGEQGMFTCKIQNIKKRERTHEGTLIGISGVST